MKRALPPVIVFALQRALLMLLAWARGLPPLAPASYSRWDSVFYLDIAAHGYVPIHSCPPESHYPASAWCGNAGWFPGYPFALKLFALPPDSAAMLLSAAAQLGCLLIVWRILDDEKQWPALALAGFFPGNVYLAAVFPLSLFVLAALCCLAACWSRRYRLAAVAGAFAATCHATGVLLAPVVLLWAAWRRRPGAVWVAVGVAIGFAAVLVLFQQEAGGWDAYFKVQAKYGYRVGFIVDTLLGHLKPLVNPHYRDAKGFFSALQTLTCLALIVALAFRTRRFLGDDRESLLVICTAAFWALPLLLGGNVSLYRSEALALPAALLLPSLGRPWQLILLAAAVAISVPMGVLFFDGVLV